jgi:hypothetical protein
MKNSTLTKLSLKAKNRSSETTFRFAVMIVLAVAAVAAIAADLSEPQRV